jgi:hypothetical protein
MAKKAAAKSSGGASVPASRSPDAKTAREDSRPIRLKPSVLLDTRVIYCGNNLEQLAKLPDACRKPMQNDEGGMMKQARFPILHSSFFLLNSPVTGSFYYHCDWHASHYVKVMLDQIFGEKSLYRASNRFSL